MRTLCKKAESSISASTPYGMLVPPLLDEANVPLGAIQRILGMKVGRLLRYTCIASAELSKKPSMF